MPFYKFGDIMLLDKIKQEDWVKYITQRFNETGKHISDDDALLIANLVECHPYYVQQLAQLAWLHTAETCDSTTVESAFESLVNQLSLLFSNIIDNLTAKQISFLQAIANGVKNLSSREVLAKYDLGTSANIKNLRKALQDKDLIDISPNSTVLQDPVFSYWLKTKY